MPSIILARVSGLDRPGITAGLMEVLAEGGCTLYDVEQGVLRDRLSLSVLIEVPEGQPTVRDVLFYAWEKGLQADFEVVDGDSPTPVKPRFAVTVIGASISPEAFGAVATAIATGGGNIDSIERLSRYPVISYELAVSGGGPGSDEIVALGHIGDPQCRCCRAGGGSDPSIQAPRCAGCRLHPHPGRSHRSPRRRGRSGHRRCCPDGPGNGR